MILVVTVCEFIDLLNVTEIDDETETNVSESEGEVEETLGAKLSVDWVGLVISPISSALQDKSINWSAK
jgi:hypothetical protein